MYRFIDLLFYCLSVILSFWVLTFGVNVLPTHV